MSGPSAEKDAGRATIAEALAAWEAKGPTSLTVALVVDALYGVREALSNGPVDPRTHGLNHAPLPEGTWLSPGFCAGCDEERTRVTSPAVSHGAQD